MHGFTHTVMNEITQCKENGHDVIAEALQTFKALSQKRNQDGINSAKAKDVERSTLHRILTLEGISLSSADAHSMLRAYTGSLHIVGAILAIIEQRAGTPLTQDLLVLLVSMVDASQPISAQIIAFFDEYTIREDQVPIFLDALEDRSLAPFAFTIIQYFRGQRALNQIQPQGGKYRITSDQE